VCTVDELLRIPSSKFLESIYFCNTDIVQSHITQHFGKDVICDIIPDCYEKQYHSLLHRNIQRCKFGDIDWTASTNGIFVKPYLNNKEFDGMVIKSPSDYGERGYPIPDSEIECYTSDIVKFASEYRLLIGNGKLYGIGNLFGENLDGIDDNAFTIIKERLVLLTGDKFRCVDIGFVPNKCKWLVVEINPPFSLDDHGIPLNMYMEFCIDACRWITAKTAKQQVSPPKK
jgi:hypothetical protein